jgi:hypothetical protein
VSLGKVVGLEMLYNFGLYNFFPPPAVTMGRYNGLLQWAVTTCTLKLNFNRGIDSVQYVAGKPIPTHW